MPAVIVTRKLAFKRPTIGKNHYLSASSAGWVENFSRASCDAALADLVGDAPVDELIDNFLEGLRLANKKEITWGDLTGYLGRIFHTPKYEISIEAAVGFWAQIVIKEKHV